MTESTKKVPRVKKDLKLAKELEDETDFTKKDLHCVLATLPKYFQRKLSGYSKWTVPELKQNIIDVLKGGEGFTRPISDYQKAVKTWNSERIKRGEEFMLPKKGSAEQKQVAAIKEGKSFDMAVQLHPIIIKREFIIPSEMPPLKDYSEMSVADLTKWQKYYKSEMDKIQSIRMKKTRYSVRS